MMGRTLQGVKFSQVFLRILRAAAFVPAPLPAAGFNHPLAGAARSWVETVCEAEHGHCASWHGLAHFRTFLRFRPREQSPRMFVLKLSNRMPRFPPSRPQLQRDKAPLRKPED
jgi:hypothetical protein